MSKDDGDELYDFYAKNSVLSSFIFENSQNNAIKVYLS